MHTGQIGGQIGPFQDAATQQMVPCSIHGNFVFVYGGDPNAVMGQLQAGILRAVGLVVQQKLAANQVALPTLSQSLPYFAQEIIAQSGAQQLGAQITQLNLQATVQAPAAPPPMTAPLPPSPQQAMANSLGNHIKNDLDPRNYDYAAKIKVGGFNIKASTDGGLDTEGLKNQVVDKAKSTVIWYGIGCLIVGLVILGLAGLGGYIWWNVKKDSSSTSAPTGSGKVVTWDGKSNFSCAGNDNVKIEGVTAKLATGTAIKAMGNCHVELVNCNITAPIGIDVMGNASVEVKGGSVTSSQFSAKALGTSAKVIFSGTKVTGKTDAQGGAKITGP